MLSWYQHLPFYIDPVAFALGGFSVRWYSISYLVGLATVYGLLRLRISKGEFPVSISNFLPNFLLVEFLAVLLGGRLGYVIFYDAPYFLAHPLAIISPYDSRGNFTGLYGMSYFGALIAALVAGYLFTSHRKANFLKWADFVAPAVALGYFFGRIGNFLNGELYGRATSSVWGMYFPADPFVLRHPSQLYEAFFEGLLLFAFLWAARKQKRWGDGFLLFAYISGYGAARFFIEFLRQPDPQLGFVFYSLTLAQILSILAVFVSTTWFVFQNRKRWYTGLSNKLKQMS